MFENKEQAVELLKALDKVAYALHGFCVKGFEIFGVPFTPTETPTTDESPVSEETPPQLLTEEAVRKVLTTKTKAGFSTQIKELLPKHGATKLSDIPKENYAALLADVEALS